MKSTMNRLPLLAAARPANVLARIPRPSPSLRFFTNTSSNVNGKDKQKFDRIGEEPLRPASSPLSTAALASSEDVAPLLKHGWALVTRAAELQRQQEKEAQSRETTIRVRDLRLAVGDEEGVDADDSRVVQALQLEKKYAFKTYTKCQVGLFSHGLMGFGDGRSPFWFNGGCR